VEPKPIALNDAEPLPEAEDLRPLAAVMNALSTPRRLAVVQRLLQGQTTMGELKRIGGGNATYDVDLLVRSGIAERVSIPGARWYEVRLIEGSLKRIGRLLRAQ